eukprot:13741532-Ditylum_brightwellii.AAC.1
MEIIGTNYNKVISALKQVIPKLREISDQRKKVLELLKWMNQVRPLPSEQLGINDRYPPFIVIEKDDYYNSSMFGTSQHFTAKSST